MSRKSEFWDWVRANEKVAPQEEKELKKAYKQAHLRMHLYDLDSVDAVRRADADGNLQLYCEFLLGINGEASMPAIDENSPLPVSEGQIPVADTPMQEELAGALQENRGATQADAENAPVIPRIRAYERIRVERERLSAIMHLSDNRTESVHEMSGCRYAYDIATACCINATTKSVQPLTPFVVYTKKNTETQKIEACREDAFYYSRGGHTLLGAAAVLRDGGADIVSRAISHTAHMYGDTQSSVQKSVCIMPDTLGEFGDGIKRQVNSLGGKYIAVPRSVIAAYSYIKSHVGCRDVEVVDLDLPIPDVTHINISQDEESGITLTRMQRRKNSDWEKYSLLALARQYITEYARANRFSLDSVVTENLLRTGDVFRVMRNECNVLVEALDGQYKTLSYSQEILRAVLRTVAAAIVNAAKEKSDGSASVVFLLNVGAGINGVMTVSDMFDGIAEVLRRIDARQVIWKEYLPELALEVVKGGRFDKLWLIKKGSRRSIAVMASEDGITVPIDEGTFTFPPHVKEVLLPLEREEFGNTVKDKKAKFSGKQLPLSEALEVELSLSYSYGNPDSYKLTARGVVNPDFVIESEWCDDEYNANEITWPEYNENNQIGLTDAELLQAKALFCVMQSRITDIQRRRYPLMEYDNRGFLESNIFQRIGYSPNLIRKITETANYKDECENIILEFVRSDAFYYIYEYLVYTQDSALYGLVKNNKNLKVYLDRSLLNFASMIGVFYGLEGDDDIEEEKEQLLRRFFEETEKDNVSHLLHASRCISYREDVMSVIAENIVNENRPNRLRSMIRDLSVVSWYNKEWMENLYGVSPQAVYKIADCCVDYLVNMSEKWIMENPLVVRDLMEATLAVCRLREYDDSILPINDSYVKMAVDTVKRLDQIVYDEGMINDLNRPFVSRVKIDPQQKINDGLEKMSAPCYLLLTQLSGSKRLKLLGFEDKN